MRLFVHATILAALAGCRTSGQFAVERRTLPAPTAPVTGIVLVADGAGDFRDLSAHLQGAILEAAMPLTVQTFAWSRGRGRILADQTDHGNHQVQGRRLAEYVWRHRVDQPQLPVYLVGSSAGSDVVLCAAALLPPDSVEKIVLLAPSVCADRDLRPTLRSARGGIDVFTSHKDRLILGLGMRVVGTTEGNCKIAAGRVGFRPVIASAEDAALYQRLRQHPWEPAQRADGHNGGHFGSTQPEFLRTRVVPLLAQR
jgi:pimeloyl-ACP methyl ester carboxylesterase